MVKKFWIKREKSYNSEIETFKVTSHSPLVNLYFIEEESETYINIFHNYKKCWGQSQKKTAFPISTKYEVGHSSAHFISFNLLPYLQNHAHSYKEL